VSGGCGFFAYMSPPSAVDFREVLSGCDGGVRALLFDDGCPASGCAGCELDWLVVGLLGILIFTGSCADAVCRFADAAIKSAAAMNEVHLILILSLSSRVAAQGL